jgi:short-subunit dehydrogenase
VDIEGAVAVVTGASAGIGKATAEALARRGARVVVCARREGKLREVAGEIEARGGFATALACDVTERGQVEDLAAHIRETHARCDVLVNNAGLPGGGPFPDLSWDQIEEITRTNYLGVLYCTKAFLPMMLEAGKGHVVNIASLAGRFAVPGSSVYSSTKHAVVAFSEALHYEVARRGVRVTAVNPGLVATEGFPHTGAARRGLRVMRPEKVADLVVRVVETGKAPEVSIPRLLAALQAVRVLAPPLYRFGLDRATRGSLRPTNARRA